MEALLKSKFENEKEFKQSLREASVWIASGLCLDRVSFCWVWAFLMGLFPYFPARFPRSFRLGRTIKLK